MFVKFLFTIVIILIIVGYATLIERKIMGTVQRRLAPNDVGDSGLLQPLADMFKLLTKETIVPSNANSIMFLTTPIVYLTTSLIIWAVVPFDFYAGYTNIKLSTLYIFASSSLLIYGLLFSGWSSNSKYPLLGALRAAAQMISYEIIVGIIIVAVSLTAGSLNLFTIVLAQYECWFFTLHCGLCVIMFICILAETNRTPFDLVEAESELVSGTHTEYSSFSFALFFLGEYANILLMSFLIVILFFGGWLSPFSTDFYHSYQLGSFWLGLKTTIVYVFISYVRMSLPRYRYNQLMQLGWKKLLPITIALIFLSFFVLAIFDGFPPFN